MVGYCIRCPARVEIPWVRGGTVAQLAEVMADEALAIVNPMGTVIEDLDQVLGLLNDDMVVLYQTVRYVGEVRDQIQKRRDD